MSDWQQAKAWGLSNLLKHAKVIANASGHERIQRNPAFLRRVVPVRVSTVPAGATSYPSFRGQEHAVDSI